MSQSAPLSLNDPSQKTILGHPVGLFVLFFTEMWERFSYYGMRAILVLFLVSELAAGGWAWPREEALRLYGLYTGLVYLTPILGGLIADRLLGFRWAVVIGALLMTLGHASLAFETEMTFYVGLGLLIIGNGFFKPNISSIVGELYKNNEVKKDAAYTIFYMGINAGAFLGILLCGYFGEKVGWSWGFGMAGIFMFLGLLQFYFGQNIFGKIGLAPSQQATDEEAAKEAHEEEDVPAYVTRDRLIVIGVFSFFTIFFWMAFEQAGGSMTIFAKDYTERILTGGQATAFKIVNTLLTIGPLAIVTWLLYQLFSRTIKKYPASVAFLGLSFVIIWGAALWMLQNEFKMKAYDISYEQDAAQVTSTLRVPLELETGKEISIIDLDGRGKLKYIPDEDKGNYESAISATVNQKIEGQTEVPASWFAILNSFFIITFAPVFSRIWESKFNPSGPTKFGIGLVLLGLGFAALAIGGMNIPKGAETASVSLFFLCIAYLFHTLGELCVSPVGLSFVSKLAPAKLVGMMFGVWFLANAIANYLAGLSGSFIDKISATYSISGFFLIFTLVPVAAGLIMFALNPLLKRMMHGVE
ncbi:MAG: peptide MFS transporter [Bacteroidota bacterium]